eukprot:SAG11_NODE_2372_length_3446_cov_9.306543_5_plen_236_part_00
MSLSSGLLRADPRGIDEPPRAKGTFGLVAPPAPVISPSESAPMAIRSASAAFIPPEPPPFGDDGSIFSELQVEASGLQLPTNHVSLVKPRAYNVSGVRALLFSVCFCGCGILVIGGLLGASYAYSVQTRATQHASIHPLQSSCATNRATCAGCSPLSGAGSETGIVHCSCFVAGSCSSTTGESDGCGGCKQTGGSCPHDCLCHVECDTGQGVRPNCNVAGGLYQVLCGDGGWVDA